MTDLRKAPGQGWTGLPNNVIRNPDLTPNAFRVLAVLHSFADDFRFNSAYVQTCSGLGRDAYRAAVTQLESLGLLRVDQTRVGGKFVWSYHTFPDSPCPENPSPVEPSPARPSPVEPSPVNPALLRRPIQKTIKENQETQEYHGGVVAVSEVVTREVSKANPSATPLDEFVMDEFLKFGWSVSIPVAQNIATRTLDAMSRDYAERYITDRLCELTGKPQKEVVRYILQDAKQWIGRTLNPPPAREAKHANKRQRERVVDQGVRTFQVPVPDDFWAYSPEEVAANKANTAARLAAEANQEEP